MTNNLKINTMAQKKEVVLFTNKDAAEFEMAALNNALNEAKTVKEYLISSEMLVNAETIEQACNKSFDAIIEDFKSKEAEKLSAFEKQFGTMAAITGNSEARLNEEAEKLRAKLLSGLPPIHYQSHYYFEYIDFKTLEVKPEIGKKFFERKNSIIADPEMVRQHQNLIDSLNYFMEKFPQYNINGVTWYLVDTLEKPCSMKLDVYDPQKNIRDFVSNRINETDYTVHKF
jgi:hypothetical protein